MHAALYLKCSLKKKPLLCLSQTQLDKSCMRCEKLACCVCYVSHRFDHLQLSIRFCTSRSNSSSENALGKEMCVYLARSCVDCYVRHVGNDAATAANCRLVLINFLLNGQIYSLSPRWAAGILTPHAQLTSVVLLILSNTLMFTVVGNKI